MGFNICKVCGTVYRVNNKNCVCSIPRCLNSTQKKKAVCFSAAKNKGLDLANRLGMPLLIVEKMNEDKKEIYIAEVKNE